MRTFRILFGWLCLILGVPFLCAFWPLGLVLLLVGLFFFAQAADMDYTKYPVAEKGRSMDFGPDGSGTTDCDR